MFELSQQLLIESLEYNTETGIFMWKKERPLSHFKNSSSYKVYQTRFAGNVAGYSSKYGNMNYLQIRIKGKLYLGHRLAWLYTHGEWPVGLIDHEDGDGLNNKISNLRPADRQINGKNCPLSKNNKSGVNGVYWNKRNQNWVAEGHYTIDGVNKKKFLGSYKDLEDAKKARAAWQEEQGGFTERHGK